MKKVVVFSDSHSGLSFMRRAIHVLKPNAFVHLGDHYDDGAVIAEENPGIPNYIVQGNCDWSLCFAEPEQMCLKVFGVLMLFFFRCKKPLYYAIVLVAAVVIWAAFRFGLGVLF